MVLISQVGLITLYFFNYVIFFFIIVVDKTKIQQQNTRAMKDEVKVTSKRFHRTFDAPFLYHRCKDEERTKIQSTTQQESCNWSFASVLPCCSVS